MVEPYIGEILAFGFDYPPRGWAQCDGQILPISQYTALYSLLGTRYGGDGRTTLGLPDLQGRAAIGYGHGTGLTPRQLGEKSGYERVTLTANELPSHHHGLSEVEGEIGCTDTVADDRKPAGKIPAAASRNDPYRFMDTEPDATMKAGSVSITGLTDNTGGGQAHYNMPPFQALNYCIALTGAYPPRT